MIREALQDFAIARIGLGQAAGAMILRRRGKHALQIRILRTI